MSETTLKAEDRTPQGKIGRLPHAVREDLNARLLNNEPARRILAWLNATPEQVWVCAEYFEGEEVTAKNLSDWKVGGYRKWLARRERADALRGLSSYAVDLAKGSGLALTDAAAAIAGGNILTLLERASDEDSVGLLEALTALRRTDLEREKMDRASNLEREKLRLKAKEEKRKDDELELKRADAERKDAELQLSQSQFEWKAAGELLKWGRKPEVQRILASKEDDSRKMEQLVLAMFGDRPEKEAPEKEVPDAG